MVMGGDEYRVSERAREIVDALVAPADRVFGLDVVDGDVATVADAVTALDACLAALRTVGFMNSRKTVWLRNCAFLSDSPASRSESTRLALAELAACLKDGLPEGVTLVVSAGKVDKRGAFYKACKQLGEVVEFAIPDRAYLAERGARDVLASELKRQRVRMGRAAADAFLGRVGTETRCIANELEKLVVSIGNRREIGVDDVRAVTSWARETPAWDLADAVGRRDLGQALLLLRQLLFQGQSHMRLLNVLETRIRELMVYREALDREWLASGTERSPARWREVPEEVDRALAGALSRDPRTAHPFRGNILAGQAAGFSSARLLRCHVLVRGALRAAVSSRIAPQVIVELALVKMLT